MRNLLRFAVVALVQSLVIGQQADVCPSGDEAVRQLVACLQGYHAVTDFTSSPNVTAIRAYCLTSSQREINCANNIIESCKRSSPTARRLLENAVNVDGIENAVVTVCNNAQLLVAQSTCIGNVQSTVVSCVIARYNAYKAKLLQLQFYGLFLGADWLERQVYIALCDYTDQVAACQDTYGEVCGQDVGFVFDAISAGSRPPVCQPRRGTFQTTTPPLQSGILVRRRRSVKMADIHSLTVLDMSSSFVNLHKRTL